MHNLGCTEELVTLGFIHSPIGSSAKRMVFVELDMLKAKLSLLLSHSGAAAVGVAVEIEMRREQAAELKAY